MDIVNGFQLCDAHYRRTGFQGKYIVGNLNLKWKWVNKMEYSDSDSDVGDNL